MATGNKDIVRRVVDEVYNKGNIDFIEQVGTSDYICHDPLAGPVDRSENKRMLTEMRRAFSGLKLTVIDVIGEGDLVAMHWRTEGKHVGDFGSVKASGKTLSLEGVSQFRMENGKIAEEWDFYDGLGMMRQLGAMPEAQIPGAPAGAVGREERPHV